MEPTILGPVDNSMPVAQEEIFGPVLAAIELEDRARPRDSPMARDTDSPPRSGPRTLAGPTASRALKAGTVLHQLRYDRGDNSLPLGVSRSRGSALTGRSPRWRNTRT